MMGSMNEEFMIQSIPPHLADMVKVVLWNGYVGVAKDLKGNSFAFDVVLSFQTSGSH